MVGGLILILASGNRGDAPFIYLKFDEGYASSAYDVSGNSNTGTLQGDAAWKSEDECVSGKCIYLDGSGDYISIPDFDLE